MQIPKKLSTANLPCRYLRVVCLEKNASGNMPVDLSSSSPRFSAKHCLAVLVQKNRNTSNLCCAFLFRLCSTDLNFNKWQKCSQKRKQIATTFSPLELICPVCTKHCLAVLFKTNRNTSNLCCAFLFRLCGTDLNFNKWQKCSQKRKQIATTFSPLELICPANNDIIVQEGAMKKFNITRMVFTTIDKVFALPQNPPSVSRKLYDVRCIADIAYSKQYPDMKLDLYFHPDQKKKYPVIFEIHGGGFSAGDKKYRRCLCKYLAKHTGAMVVNVNYGVGAESACPVPMKQLVDAANWVADNAQKYNLDLSRFVVTGDSAGAYYSCFLAVLQDSPRLQQLFQCNMKAKFTATVLNCGVYDMVRVLNRKSLFINGVCKEFTGLGIDEACKSPYLEAFTLTSSVTDSFPPTLLIYSKSDVFCKGQGELLLHTLEEHNVAVEHICAKSVFDNHVYSLMWITSMARQTNESILRYLNRHFYGKDTVDMECQQCDAADVAATATVADNHDDE